MYRLAAALFVSIPVSILPGHAAAQTVSTVASGIGASGDLSIGPDGRVYVADFGATLREAGGADIYRLTADGEIETFSSGFGGASGNEFGPGGVLYQSDVARGEVYRVAPDGTRTRIAEGLQTPVGVAPGPDGSVYVVQCVPNVVARIMADGSVETVAQGAPLNCPNGLTFGADGRLYAVNFRSDDMVAIDPATGEMEVHAVIPGGGNGHVAAWQDRFYVASFRGHRIYEVTAAGQVCLVAGTGEPGNADGEAGSATFFRPNGVAVTADGDTLYTNTVTVVVDRESPVLHPNAVRRVSGLSGRPPCNGPEAGERGAP